MKKQFLKVRAGDEEFPACWDMTAWANFEKLSGSVAFAGFTISANNVLDALWSAIDAAAAHQDKDAPISRRRLGTLITSTEEMNAQVDVVRQLVEGFMPEPKGSAGKAGSGANRSQSPDATSSPESTLELASASSGD